MRVTRLLRRSVVVTGGADGIGRGIVEAFLAAGMALNSHVSTSQALTSLGDRVACFDVNADKLQQLATLRKTELESQRMALHRVDVSSEADVRAAVDSVAKQ
jgi:NAD(P)-dependent dehydrogenase (short-subunit alcohol dehydrogenase family)